MDVKPKDPLKMRLLNIKDLPQKTQETIWRLSREINFDDSRNEFWENLGDKDKTKLKKVIHNQIYHVRNKTIPNATLQRMWNILHDEPEVAGIINIAYKLGIIRRNDRDELLERIGFNAAPFQLEKQKLLEKKEIPFWNPQEGSMYYCGQVVLKTQRRKKPSNIQKILDGFQNEGWVDEIKNPLIKTDYRIKDGVEYLNGLAKGIRFSVAAGGNCIRWIPQKASKK